MVQFDFKTQVESFKKSLDKTAKQSISLNILNNWYMKIQNRDTKNYVGIEKKNNYDLTDQLPPKTD